MMLTLLTVKETKRPQTFYLLFNWEKYYNLSSGNHLKSKNAYYNEVLNLVEQSKKIGLTPMIKKRFTYNSLYYITFRSKHDAMAFKLRWI